MQKTPSRRFPLALGAVLALSLGAACSPVGMLVGAGASAGVAVAQDRGLGGVARDTATKGVIMQSWIDADHRLITDLGVDVYEGRVLLTGTISDPARRDLAVSLAWQGGGVREVFNEIRLVTPEQVANGLIDLSRDTWLATRIKATLTVAEDIMAINYVVTVHDRRVYILGIAQSSAEWDRVVARVRGQSGVRRITHYVRIKGAENAS